MKRRQAEKIGKQALHPRALDLVAHPVASRREERAARLLARLWRRHQATGLRVRAVLRLGRRALRWRLQRGKHGPHAAHYGDGFWATYLLNGWPPPRRGAP